MERKLSKLLYRFFWIFSILFALFCFAEGIRRWSMAVSIVESSAICLVGFCGVWALYFFFRFVFWKLPQRLERLEEYHPQLYEKIIITAVDLAKWSFIIILAGLFLLLAVLRITESGGTWTE